MTEPIPTREELGVSEETYKEMLRIAAMDITEIAHMFDHNCIPMPPTLDEADELGLTKDEYAQLCDNHAEACHDDHCLFCGWESHFHGW